MPVRVLLDEQLPRQLGPYLTGHEVRTVQQESRAGLKNGDLLDRAEAAGFAALVLATRVSRSAQRGRSLHPSAVITYVNPADDPRIRKK